jgi:hypothetical protein
MTEKKNPLGPTGKTVAANVKRLRGGMQFKELAARLEEIGRPIPVLGLRRIEAEERRVDADDLVALAIVLGVSPVTLLMPYTIDKTQPAPLTGAYGPLTSERVWLWLQADVGLAFVPSSLESWWDNRLFRHNTRPPWEPERTSSRASYMMLTPAARDALEADLDAKEADLDAKEADLDAGSIQPRPREYEVTRGNN